MIDSNHVQEPPTVEPQFQYLCFECYKPCNWLAPDSRCGECTRYTPAEIKGEEEFDD